jgi:hypothetical protein
MAHPPMKTSDLTFSDFCRRICKHNRSVEPYRRHKKKIQNIGMLFVVILLILFSLYTLALWH